MSMLTYKVAAKTNVGMVRSNNEDNFIVNPDLTTEEWFCSNDENIYDLGISGLLLAVADGMGGAEAGELASKLAVDAVRNYFNEFISSNSGELTDEKISEALVEVLHQANKSIIDRTREEPETRGMGTTMILGWLYESTMHVGWIGDSRAYLVREGMPLQPASRDHSFVQELVNAGKLSYSDSFYHPDSNIITQSLGNPDHDLQPEVYRFDVGKGDLILLCSDGLNGMLTDEYLDGLLRDHRHDPLVDIADLLISNANEAGGADNITVGLITVENAPRNLTGVAIPPLDGSAEERSYSLGGTIPTGEENFELSKSVEKENKPTGRKTRKLLYLTLFLLLAALGVIAWLIMKDTEPIVVTPEEGTEIKDEPDGKKDEEFKNDETSSEINGGGEEDHVPSEEAVEAGSRQGVPEQETRQNRPRPQDAGQGTQERGGPLPESPPVEEQEESGGDKHSGFSQGNGGLTAVDDRDREDPASAISSASANDSRGQSPADRVLPGGNIDETVSPTVLSPNTNPVAQDELWKIEIPAREVGFGKEYYIPVDDYSTLLDKFRKNSIAEIPDGGDLDATDYSSRLEVINFINKEEARAFIKFLKTETMNNPLFPDGDDWFRISKM